jgi:hypothetical protein
MDIDTGVIRAWRHIHVFGDAMADQFGVKDGDLMALRVNGDMCTATLGDVMVRFYPLPDLSSPAAAESVAALVRSKIPDAAAAQEAIDMLRALPPLMGAGGATVHLDTDEGNAVMLADAASFDLFKQAQDGSLVHVGHHKNLAARRPGRAAMAEREREERPGAVRYERRSKL